MKKYLDNLYDGIVIIDIKKQILNKKNLYDRIEIEHRENNTYYDKIIGILIYPDNKKINGK